MTLKVCLNEGGLFVNKFKCNSVTIYQVAEDEYKADLFDVEGITKRVPKMTRWGKQELDKYTGEPLFDVLRRKKTLRSNKVEFVGEIKLVGSATYQHAVNKNKEYINFYTIKKDEVKKDGS